MSAVYGWFDISFKKEDGSPDGEMAKRVCASLLEQYAGWGEENFFGLECDEKKGEVWVESDYAGFYTKYLDYNDTEFQKTIFETFKPAKMISKVTCDHAESDGRIDYWRSRCRRRPDVPLPGGRAPPCRQRRNPASWCTTAAV